MRYPTFSIRFSGGGATGSWPTLPVFTAASPLVRMALDGSTWAGEPAARASQRGGAATPITRCTVRSGSSR